MEEESKRIRRLTIRFTPDEYEELLKRAKENEENISALIRRMAFKGEDPLVFIRIASDIRKLRLDLNGAIKRYEATGSDVMRREIMSAMKGLYNKLLEYEEVRLDGDDDAWTYKNK